MLSLHGNYKQCPYFPAHNNLPQLIMCYVCQLLTSSWLCGLFCAWANSVCSGTCTLSPPPALLISVICSTLRKTTGKVSDSNHSDHTELCSYMKNCMLKTTALGVHVFNTLNIDQSLHMPWDLKKILNTIFFVYLTSWFYTHWTPATSFIPFWYHFLTLSFP